MKKTKQPSHFQYEGRNVLFGSRRAQKIDAWEHKEEGKRTIRIARRLSRRIAARRMAK
jgi:hypothetical protein